MKVHSSPRRLSSASWRRITTCRFRRGRTGGKAPYRRSRQGIDRRLRPALWRVAKSPLRWKRAQDLESIDYSQVAELSLVVGVPFALIDVHKRCFFRVRNEELVLVRP